MRGWKAAELGIEKKNKIKENISLHRPDRHHCIHHLTVCSQQTTPREMRGGWNCVKPGYRCQTDSFIYLFITVNTLNTQLQQLNGEHGCRYRSHQVFSPNTILFHFCFCICDFRASFFIYGKNH